MIRIQTSLKYTQRVSKTAFDAMWRIKYNYIRLIMKDMSIMILAKRDVLI